MMRLTKCVFILLLIAASCTRKDKVPGDVMPKEKMEKVLWELMQADRFANSFLLKDSTTDIKTKSLQQYEKVFEINGITRDEFMKSYQFYSSRPDISKVLFDSLSSRADRVRDEQYNGPASLIDKGIIRNNKLDSAVAQ